MKYQEINSILEYIETHYTGKISISDLRNIVHVCEDKFTRSFKDITGVTPTKYIMDKRISHSINLLLTTNLPLEEIAIMSGFGSNSYMTRCFKQKLNTTPGRYRVEKLRRKGKNMNYKLISGFSDEISPAIKEQFEELNKLGIQYFEPRGIDGKNISKLTEEEMYALKETMDEYGIKVSSIGSPVGKIQITEDFEPHMPVLENVVKAAKILGTKYIRMFSFYHSKDYDWTEEERQEVFRRTQIMIDYAKENDVILLHENEKGIYGDTADRCLDLMEHFYGPNYKSVFDPANFVQTGEDTKRAYEMLRPYTEYMHIKDAVLADGSVVPSGYGDGNVPYILKELFASGYNGFLSLEPHLTNFNGFADLENGEEVEKKPMDKKEAFELAHESLIKILDEIPIIRLGVIGYGNMGTTHCKNTVIGKVPNMVLSAICDSSEARRNVAKELYSNVDIFENATDLFKSGLCDLVIIATPHYGHPELVAEAFSYGLHVIVEKPAAVYTKQALEMNEAAAKSDKTFAIMYNQRTNPVYKKVREMVQSGELGHIKRISWIITDWYRPQAYHDSSAWRSSWELEGGGTLINQNPHQLDLWQWMFGMPDQITAFASFGKYYDIEVEDDVTAFFQYNNGTTGTYITSTGEAPGTNRLEIACDMGRLIVEKDVITFAKNAVSEREFNKTNTKPFGKIEVETIEVPVEGTFENHPGIFKDVVNHIISGTELLAPGHEGINGLTISNAMHYSAWTGKTVDVNNFPHEEFYGLLQEKIQNSTMTKKTGEAKIADTEGSY